MFCQSYVEFEKTNMALKSLSSLTVTSFVTAVSKVYYLVLRITNVAGVTIRLIPSDKQPPEGFTVGKNTIAVIKKKVSSPLPVTFRAIDASESKLYINYKSEMILTPTESEGSPIPLTVTVTRKCAVLRICHLSWCHQYVVVFIQTPTKGQVRSFASYT